MRPALGCNPVAITADGFAYTFESRPNLAIVAAGFRVQYGKLDFLHQARESSGVFFPMLAVFDPELQFAQHDGGEQQVGKGDDVSCRVPYPRLIIAAIRVLVSSR